MKKQINPTIKAHLIRGAFYLLLLVAVCAIPFALAQRNTIKRGSPAQAIKDVLRKRRLPPRLRTKPLSGINALWHRSMLLQSKAASQSKDGSRLRASDVRRLPGQSRFSSAAHSRKPFGPRTTRLLRSLLPNSVYMLDDGTAEDGVGFGNGSQNFESLWINQFNVIAGQTLIIP